MPTAFDRLEYAIPGSNGISLDKKLADQIRKHFNTDRENRFQLFLLAAGIRNKYLNKKTGHYSERGFNSPVHSNLRASEGVKNLLR